MIEHKREITLLWCVNGIAFGVGLTRHDTLVNTDILKLSPVRHYAEIYAFTKHRYVFQIVNQEGKPTHRMMTSSNGNIFRVTGHLCGEFTGPGEFPTQRPVTRSFDVYFDLRPNKRLSKQSLGWWFETLSPPLWRHRNGKSGKHGGGGILPINSVRCMGNKEGMPIVFCRT